MENETETSSALNEDPGSHFYLTDVAVERSNEAIDSDELVDSANGRCYPLVSVTPGKWEVKGAIKLPRGIREIRCEIHCTRRHVHYFVDIDCAGAELPEPNFKKELRRNTELSDGNQSMVISFGFTTDLELGITSGADGAFAAYINACSCDGCSPGLCYTRKAIEMLQSALRLTPSDHPSTTRCLLKLGAEHTRAFQESQDPSHLDSALSAISNALDLTARSDPEFPKHLWNLARIHMLRFNLTQDISSLDEAISKLREAVETTQEEDPGLSCRQNILGHLLRLRFEGSRGLSDLSDSIDAKTMALETTLACHPHLHFLASELRHSFEAFAQHVSNLVEGGETMPPEWINEKVGTHSCACDTRDLLCTLGILLRRRFERTAASSDIDAAISVQRLLVFGTPESHPEYSSFLNDLGSSLLSRFRRHGNICDIDEAISLFQRSASGEHPPSCHHGQGEDGRNCVANSIASCLLAKYNVTQNRSYLDDAISTLQRMVSESSNTDSTAHPCMDVWLSNLARFFDLRFQETRDPQDQSEAISIQKRLVQSSHRSEGHGCDIGPLTTTLNSSLVQFASLEDIDRAISLGRTNIKLCPESDSAELPHRLQSLANLLRHRVQPRLPGKSNVTGLAVPLPGASPKDTPGSDLPYSLAFDYLTEAVGLLRKTVELTPIEDPDFPARLSTLADCLHARFDHANDPRDIQEALAVMSRAITLVPDRHAAIKTSYQAGLAELYHCRYTETEIAEDQEETLEIWEHVLSSPFLSPRERLETAVRFSRHCINATKIIAAFDSAVDAATLVVGLDRTVAQRYSHIQGFSEMPLEGAAVACRFDRPDKALEWLEQGRCHVWNQLNTLRTPLEALLKHDPVLATEISSVSKRLEEAGSTRPLIDYEMPQSRTVSLDDEARAHAKLARRWDELLVKARAIPGFESFLKPLTYSSLVSNLPPSGNIVIVTAHDKRCDAIALVAGLGEPLHIPLPELTISKAREYGAIMNRKLRAHGFRRQEVDMRESDEEEIDNAERGIRRYRAKDQNILYVLKALWIEVVKPILDALAISKADNPSANTLHRIWWCPTGVLSFLPLHAAGIYTDVGSESILDYIVSSYTPSISSLLERFRNDRQVEEGVSGLFLTSQPNVHGQKRLAGTTKEVNSIHEITEERGIRVFKTEGSMLSVDNCLKYMEEYSSVHFACHGVQSADDPLKSRLLLGAGALELGEIMRKNLKHADLAFLSACQTSTGQEKLDNEAVHLAAGMLAAGYQRVVGTMWEIRDSHAVDVANDFYGYLLDHQEEGGEGRFDGSRSAHALHHAVRQLRARIDDAREVRSIPDDLEESLLMWIPYVHYGY
ncbi:hypothetical protein FA13DRAFT_347552 [Coprinellus micaceus]|uniref:CHAT domain-containing protein n=1 Tax=Coprinellus micaceus TaxID=71717 RepID=A0A4Y7SCT9_COPMI|nr:hypothetical protein FA13DRAFT_347552 [Coprinellus micaceus]